MRKYYIRNNGTLKRRENTICFEQMENEELVRKVIPVNDIDCIYTFGEVDLNTKMLNFISQYDILIHFFNYYGYYSGSYIPKKKNVSGTLLVDQVQHFADPEKRMYIAASFVDSAVFHIIRNLRKNNIAPEKIAEIESYIPKIYSAETPEQLMGVEGNIRNKYYKLFNEITKHKDFSFEKRVRQPPDNPINAMISFGNALMYTTVLTEIYRTQLDPTISFLHDPGEKRFSLSLDIAEIFKPFLIDPLIFSLINKKEITLDDFDQDLNYANLNKAGKDKFLAAYQEKLDTTVKHRTLARSVSYKYLIRFECYKLIKHFIDDDIYKPFKAWW